MTKTILRLTASGGLLLLTGLMVLAAKFFGGVVFAFYPEFSRSVTGVLAAVTSVVPFALCEVLLVALVLWFLISLIRAIVRRRLVRWVTGVLLIVCILLTAFVGIWGLNYYAPPMRERLGLSDRQFTVAELKEATLYFGAQAGALAGQV